MSTIIDESTLHPSVKSHPHITCEICKTSFVPKFPPLDNEIVICVNHPVIFVNVKPGERDPPVSTFTLTDLQSQLLQLTVKNQHQTESITNLQNQLSQARSEIKQQSELLAVYRECYGVKN